MARGVKWARKRPSASPPGARLRRLGRGARRVGSAPRALPRVLAKLELVGCDLGAVASALKFPLQLFEVLVGLAVAGGERGRAADGAVRRGCLASGGHLQ